MTGRLPWPGRARGAGAPPGRTGRAGASSARAGAPVRRRVAAGALAALLSGCAAGSPPTGSASAVPPVSRAALAPCADLSATETAVSDTARSFDRGSAGADQVRVAATALAAIVSARLAEPRPPAGLTDVDHALTRLRAAAALRPPDRAAVRTAAGGTVTALRTAVARCRSGGR